MTKSKGSFFFNEQSKIISHQYSLRVSQDTNVFLTVEPLCIRPGGRLPHCVGCVRNKHCNQWEWCTSSCYAPLCFYSVLTITVVSNNLCIFYSRLRKKIISFSTICLLHLFNDKTLYQLRLACTAAFLQLNFHSRFQYVITNQFINNLLPWWVGFHMVLSAIISPMLTDFFRLFQDCKEH